MIKTASLENSKRLYELAPEWNDTEFFWHNFGTDTWHIWYPNKEMAELLRGVDIPAPDLDWLLDKLPSSIGVDDKRYLLMLSPNYSGSAFTAKYVYTDSMEALHQTFAHESCDAACKLLIKLIEEGLVEV